MIIEFKDTITLFGILVSLIIGFFSIYIGFKNSKKTIFINSVTASRTKWIDTIRNTIAEYCSIALLVSILKVDEQSEKLYKLQQLKFLIKLQLNRNDKFDILILSSVDLIYDVLIKKNDKFPELNFEIDKLINLTQDLLKLEWEGVKEETKKGNLSKREKSKLYNRFLKHHISEEK